MSPTIEKSIVAGSDDTGCRAGVWQPDGDELGFGKFNGGDYTSQLRFIGITIPPGSTITVSNLTCQATGCADNKTTRGEIAAEDAADPTQCESCVDLLSRVLTTARVEWDVPCAATPFEIVSDDISSIIQELVDTYGGLSNAAISIFLLDDESDSDIKTYFATWEFVQHAAPALLITYIPGAVGYAFIM